MSDLTSRYRQAHRHLGRFLNRVTTRVSLTLSVIVCLLGFSLEASATEYTVLDSRYGYGAKRHAGETRVGTLGTIASNAAVSDVSYNCPTTSQARCVIDFDYTFPGPRSNRFAGAFFSFGRVGIQGIDRNCTLTDNLSLNMDSVFNFNDLMLNTIDDQIAIDSIRMVLRFSGRGDFFRAHVEIKDHKGQTMDHPIVIDFSNTDVVTLDLALSNFNGSINLNRVKILSLIIKENSVNPFEGGFAIETIGLVDADAPSLSANTMRKIVDDRELIEELARRDFESLIRLVDAKTGASLDRTLFRDLIHWGATGWLLASLPAAAKRGWIQEGEARRKVLKVLRFVDQNRLWGDDVTGMIGNSRGVMYRFGGVDPNSIRGPLTGTRKLDENDCNAVEASIIDTALFHFGAATAAAGFAEDRIIVDRVQSILNRTHWDELVDPATGQLFLSWKPERDEDPCFTVEAVFGGFWASRKDTNGHCGNEPLTIDYWTDEGGLAAILAAGSGEHSAGPDPWYEMKREEGIGECEGLVATWPGAWFTYAFMTATYLDPRLGSDQSSINWRTNARRAFDAFRRLHLTTNGLALPDAVELPDTSYLAQGAIDCALDPNATFTKTRTPWSLQLAVGLGGQTARRAIAEIRRILRRRTWDPIFGLLDSFHPNLSAFVNESPDDDQQLLRKQGLWVQQQVWPLNKGGALLAQLNFLDAGIVWRMANRHPVVQRGIDMIYRQVDG